MKIYFYHDINGHFLPPSDSFHLRAQGSPMITSITIFYPLVSWSQVFSFSINLSKATVIAYRNHFKDIKPSI